MIIPFPYPINLILVVLLDLFGLYLSFVVYWANRSSKVNRGFLLMVVTILSWVNFYYLAQGNNSTFWYRFSATSVFFFFIAYYFFIIRWFLQKEGWYKIFGWFVLVYGLIAGILSVTTSLVISDSKVVSNYLIRPILGISGWWIFYGFVITITLIVNWILMKESLIYSKENRSKVQYFLVGLFMFAGFNIIFNVVFPAFLDDYRFYELGNYSIVFFLGFTAYAIVKHKLFDIKILISQLLVFAILVFVAIRVVLSNNAQELLINFILLVLVLVTGALLLKSISKETELTKKLLEETKRSLSLEKQLRDKITKKAGEMIKKMEDIVKE